MNLSVMRVFLLVLAIVGLCCSCSKHKKSQVKTTACSDNSQCQTPLQCVDGYCKQPCDDTNKCPNGMTCQSGFCATLCQGDEDCADDEQCLIGTCVLACVDNDHDGYGKNCPLGDDCDDNDPTIHPGAPEVCGDKKDNNCDGQVDEAPCCTIGATVPCYTGTAGTEGKGICHGGAQVCGSNDCVGQQTPLTKNECYGVDYNCDGVISTDGCVHGCDPDCQCTAEDITNNGCECKPPTGVPCYPGPIGTLGVGECKNSGIHDCKLDSASGKYLWTPCVERDSDHPIIVPVAEVCGDNKDNDCDGVVDNGCTPNPPYQNCGITNGCGSCTTNDTTKNCYTGPVNTMISCDSNNNCVLHPPCKMGTMTCINGEFWSECIGETLPQSDDCNFPNADLNCDGITAANSPAGLHPINANACGTCGEPPAEVCNGLDDNCNGLIDEGVISACGKCVGDPCYEENWGTPGKCDDLLRNCGDGALPVVCPPPGNTTGTDCITLGEGTIQTPYIYLAIYNYNEVAKLDTVTGALIWKVDSLGRDPSRTAVALDQTVWVANRAIYQGGYTDPQYSNVVHLAADGSLICRADTPYVARSVAIDGDGNVWMGTWYANNPTGSPPNSYPAGKLLFKISGTQVDAGTPPRCHIISATNLTTPINYLPNSGNTNGIYGLAVDGNGFLWTASHPKLQIDTKNPTSIYSVPITNTSFYGISIDQNNDVWLGGDYGNGGPLHKVHCNSHDATHNNICNSATTTNSNPALNSITGVAVDNSPDPDHPTVGNIWGADCNNNRLVKINPVTLTVECYKNVDTTKSTCPWGVAVDSAGKVWATNRYAVNHQVWVDRFDPDCAISTRDSFLVESNHAAPYPDNSPNATQDPQIYTYSDMTGFQLQNITTRNAHWIQRFDSGYLTPIWANAVFGGLIPQYTSISLSFVAADTEAGLATAPAGQKCGPYAVTYPNLEPFTVDITSKPECTGLSNHRWLMIDVLLSTTQNGVRPIFRDLHVTWTRPLMMP